MPLPINTLMTAGGETLGVRFDPFMSYNFLIEIDMLITGGFTQVQGLDSQIELEEYQEGGTYGYTHKFPKRVNSSNLILTKGLTVFPTLWNWYEDTMNGKIKRKNGTIMLLDHQRLPIMWWNFTNAFPVKWSGPQFDSSSGEVAIESIELVHQGISRPIFSKLLPLSKLPVISKFISQGVSYGYQAKEEYIDIDEKIDVIEEIDIVEKIEEA